MSKKMSLEDHADEIRKDLAVPRQSDVFKAAVEAGYLVALADSGVDATEREVLVKAVEMLSKGLVIEWETDALIEEFAQRAEADGVEKCCERVGNILKETGQGEAGLFIAALVARATKGIAKSEAEVMKAIGKTAGVTPDKMKDIVKRATLGEETS
jgi:tellurite resistance protein